MKYFVAVATFAMVLLATGCRTDPSYIDRAGASLDSPEEMTGSGTGEFLGHPKFPAFRQERPGPVNIPPTPP